MIINYKVTIGDMIAMDFRTAALFLGYEIDLLTERDKTIAVVCKDNEINLLHLMGDLNAILTSTRTPSSNYSSWPLRLLSDLISIRYSHLKDNLPLIKQFLDRLSEIHEGHNQRIIDLRTSFNTCAKRLILSLQRQAPILFSLIKQMIRTEEDHIFFTGSAFETVGYSIKRMTDDLSIHKQNFLSVVGLINSYVPPLNACGCYKISQDLLTELQNDLYKIICLQNILYTRVMALRNKQVMDYQ